MPRERYQQQIATLRADVVDLSDLVRERLSTGVAAVENSDARRGRRLAEGDDEVDRRSLAVESDCVDLLALQQPVASDLRFVAASFKIATDLERVGDLAVNLGEYAMAADVEGVPSVDVGEMGAVATEMLETATTAYAEGDATRCRSVAERDDELDALCDRASRSVTADLLTNQVPDAEVEGVLSNVRRLLLTVRDLERAGDHAVNVAARTLYALEGSDELI